MYHFYCYFYGQALRKIPGVKTKTYSKARVERERELYTAEADAHLRSMSPSNSNTNMSSASSPSSKNNHISQHSGSGHKRDSHANGSVVYTEENTQQSIGSYGSDNLNEDSNMSFPEHSELSEHNENAAEFSHDSNDADPQMRVALSMVREEEEAAGKKKSRESSKNEEHPDSRPPNLERELSSDEPSCKKAKTGS
ncbi:hypothetical protein RRG08_004693 [Elysia crispata]|uniref:Uncharacterized protein n=1 Tax=Elysia crispata TaxID=231223 RepID=A0AAE1B043_9GAST|nr:hypothetical protein RRG08_004693 [Elysia crispata]